MAPPDFRRLFEAAPALFMVLAPDPPKFTVLAASDDYLKAVKKRREDLIGLPVFEALPVSPEDKSSETNSRASFQRAIDLRVPDTMAVQRHDLKRPDSEGGGFETRYWSPVNTPVLDDDGHVLYIIHRVEDVTDFVQAQQHGAQQQALAESLQTRAGLMEREIYRRAQEIQEVNRSLREANTKLGELDRAKTAFFSNVSHEFRTPLTLLLGTLEEQLGRNDLPRGAVADLTVAHRNALRLLKLVNALLDFARMEAGRVQARYQPTDLGTATAELASSFHSICEKAGLRFLINCLPTRQPYYVDRGMWEKIVLNLVSNAFKFTLEGEIEVRTEDTAAGCLLCVRDTGVGIPADELPRVFERFHRVQTTRGRSLEGTGIGLSLVYELAKMQGCRVEVESEVGKGSTFRVIVPAGTAHLPADHVVSAQTSSGVGQAAAAFVQEAARWIPDVLEEEPPPAGPEPDAVRPRVLLADDNADMRDYIRRLLAPRFDVQVAKDGREALRLAQRTRPDLVLTDIMMPGLDGFALLRELRTDANLRATPVILISARAGEDTKGEGLEAGADDYIVKPFSGRELVARVASNLKLAQFREEVAKAAAREDALKDTDQRKNQFLAMLSHELRNPLAPIRNSLYILERAVPGGDQAKRAHQVIDRQVAHLTRMVEDLLDLSRITQSKLEVQKERVDFAELVTGVVEDMRANFESRGVGLDVHLAEGPLWVSGDPTRLAQVVGNLLGNAAKFTPAGRRTEVSVQVEAGETVRLVVRDDGIGIHRDVLQRLFQPFVQADKTVDRRGGGMGLGLAIVKGLVEAHGGTVTARSDGHGKGAEFAVRLPLGERVKPHLSVVSALPRRVPSKRVLVIEDNRDAAESLREALELSGYEVMVASDGRAGVDLARRWRPDAVISDIGMPQMDGYQVARTLRAEPSLSGLCLVAVTGYAALDDVHASASAGFDHHLSKPPDMGELERILATCTRALAADQSS